MSATDVDLGFLDKCEPWLLTNKYFPSKVGGLPAWLDLESIPSKEIIKCSACSETMLFLCQVYAPLEELEQCFHRMLYVFICRNTECWQPNVSDTIKVLRCQLPRTNKFYDFDPAPEDAASDEVASALKLCQVCGCRGPLSCGSCKQANYCSAVHQKIDWSLGEHKTHCKTANTTTKLGNAKHGFLLEEFELVTEGEELAQNDNDNDSDDDEEERRLQDYEDYVNEHEPSSDLKDVPTEEFEKYVSTCDDDDGFRKFKKRIQSDPEQVIRFCRTGSPLWITNKHIPESNAIPVCDRCQTPRVFEFQIMPQLLNSLPALSVDWGVITVFTCKDSCDTNGTYVIEHCHKQDIVSEEGDE